MRTRFISANTVPERVELYQRLAARFLPSTEQVGLRILVSRLGAELDTTKGQLYERSRVKVQGRSDMSTVVKLTDDGRFRLEEDKVLYEPSQILKIENQPLVSEWPDPIVYIQHKEEGLQKIFPGKEVWAGNGKTKIVKKRVHQIDDLCLIKESNQIQHDCFTKISIDKSVALALVPEDQQDKGETSSSEDHQNGILKFIYEVAFTAPEAFDKKSSRNPEAGTR